MESFDYEVSTLFQNYLKAEFKVNIIFSPKLLNKNLRAAHNFTQVKYNPKLRETIRHFEKIYNVIRKEFKVYLHSKSNNIYPKVIDIERTFDLSHDKIIIEADKNVGYVCIFKQDLLEQYAKINVQQHFGLVNITEKWYIENMLKFIKDAKVNLPLELSKIILKTDFNWKEPNSEIGVLRLQPKVLKLKVINYEHIDSLTSRGIKNSMKDPIKVIQKILDKVFSHLLFYVEEKFHSMFGIVSPSVTGVTETINRFKKTKTGDWGNSLELEGDFSDLYSNCNVNLLLECVEESCKYAHFHASTFSYIKLLITCIMSHSYFKQPSGIYKTLKGFSMGDCSAARGSELILRIYEIKMFTKLSRNNLHKNVLRFLRFRDDVSIHIKGSNTDIIKVIRIIGNGYPLCIKFNMESKIVHGKFLNIRMYNNPLTNVPYTTVLRKPQNKYNIIPPGSNTHSKYKKMAGLSYFNTTRSHTVTRKERINQFKVIHSILECKGFNKNQIKEIQNMRKNKNPEKRKFLSKTCFNEVTQRHKFIHKIFKVCHFNPEKYYRPMEIPGKKLEQMIFTIRKMRRKLNF